MPINPHKGEAEHDFVARAHKELFATHPDSDERNAIIFSIWRKHHGESDAEKRAHAKFAEDDRMAFSHLTNVPHFKEHEYPWMPRDKEGKPKLDDDGQPVIRKENYDFDSLKAICENLNHRIADTGDFVPLTDKHNPKRGSEESKPGIVGFAGPFGLGQVGNKEPKWAIIAKQEHWYRDKAHLAREFPRRSPEVYLGRPMHDRILDPTTVLGADTPALDMGIHYSQNAVAGVADEFNAYYSGPPILAKYAFDENKHPRASGKFAAKSGAGAGPDPTNPIAVHHHEVGKSVAAGHTRHHSFADMSGFHSHMSDTAGEKYTHSTSQAGAHTTTPGHRELPEHLRAQMSEEESPQAKEQDSADSQLTPSAETSQYASGTAFSAAESPGGAIHAASVGKATSAGHAHHSTFSDNAGLHSHMSNPGTGHKYTFSTAHSPSATTQSSKGHRAAGSTTSPHLSESTAEFSLHGQQPAHIAEYNGAACMPGGGNTFLPGDDSKKKTGYSEETVASPEVKPAEPAQPDTGNKSMISPEDANTIIQALMETGPMKWVLKQMEADAAPEALDQHEPPMGAEPGKPPMAEGKPPVPPGPPNKEQLTEETAPAVRQEEKEQHEMPVAHDNESGDRAVPEPKDEEPPMATTQKKDTDANEDKKKVGYSEREAAREETAKYAQLEQQVAMLLAKNAETEKNAAVAARVAGIRQLRLLGFDIDCDEEIQRCSLDNMPTEREFQNHLDVLAKYSQRIPVGMQLFTPDQPLLDDKIVAATRKAARIANPGSSDDLMQDETFRDEVAAYAYELQCRPDYDPSQGSVFEKAKRECTEKRLGAKAPAKVG